MFDLGGKDPMEMTKQAITALVQNIAGGDLRDIFQIVVGEMYIRSETDELFAERWGDVSEKVLEMFNANTTPEPEILSDYQEARNELNEARARRFDSGFEGDALNELKALFDQHGVAEEPGENPDTPGLYL